MWGIDMSNTTMDELGTKEELVNVVNLFKKGLPVLARRFSILIEESKNLGGNIENLIPSNFLISEEMRETIDDLLKFVDSGIRLFEMNIDEMPEIEEED